ncbi:MAG: GntP family permease [Oscillospiraceae bacterium]|nr:GntP family permease [Oscillospiraceae bacterium]
MSPVISLAGIVIGLILLMYLAYKGHSIIWVAPVCAVVVAVMGGLSILDSYLGDYIEGVAEYIVLWFPAFFLGAVYGKLMDMTGSARSLAGKIVDIIGPKFAVAAVVIPCMLMTYGGISLFVVVFVVYPMGYAIYRAANLPRTLLPSAIAFGAFGITMTAVPGTPQIQNIIPTEYYGTTATAAPLMSIVAVIAIGVPGYIYLEWRARQARKQGLQFEEDPKYKDNFADKAITLPKWHWLCGLIPLIVVVLMLNVLPGILEKAGMAEWSSSQAIVVALFAGIIVTCIMNIKQLKILLPAISEGANGSLLAIMNTACAVGFGSVVKVVPGFALLKTAMLNMPGSILFSEAVAVNVLAGATGSASGGMSIALAALGQQYLEKANAIGLNPEYLHRIAAIASGGLDSLPHNGAILTLFAVSNCTHKESYKDLCVVVCVIPVVVSLILALVWGLFI